MGQNQVIFCQFFNFKKNFLQRILLQNKIFWLEIYPFRYEKIDFEGILDATFFFELIQLQHAVEDIYSNKQTNKQLITYLTNKGSNPDNVINRIGKQPNEDISLSVDLTSVNLVKQSHHDERVEDHGEMNRGWRLNIRPFTIIEIEDYIP